MKVFVLSIEGHIQGVVVANDEDVQEVHLKMVNANVELKEDTRLDIQLFSPDSVEDAVDYIRSC